MGIKEPVFEKAVLAEVISSGAALSACETELDELEGLLTTAGGEAVARLVQIKDNPDPGTYLGSGKVEELRELCEREEIELVIFNSELSPSQIRNLEDATGARVIDRTMLILDIFALHAQSAEGKLQVELAQLRYSAPRLIGKGAALSRQEGRIGTRGPGESKLESDRRYLKRRAAALEERLEKMTQTRTTMRAARSKSDVPKAAIVGYTNAGKSTLLNYLTDAGVLAENKLFATLDPTTRRLTLPDGKDILLTDTVGFIRRLPHHLIKAFRSTLEEAALADLLLIVVDASDQEWREQLQVTENLLLELGAGDLPRIIVFNKCDLLPEEERPKEETGERVFLSAKSGEGVDLLLQTISELLKAGKEEVSLLLPYSESKRLHSLMEEGLLLSEPSYLDTGIAVTALFDQRKKNEFSEFILGQ